MSKKLTKEEYIEKANKIHNYRYDYSLIDITKNDFEIICPIHGIFK